MNLQQLLIASGKNNLTAQKEVYMHFARSMFLLCRRYLKTDVEAEEVMMTGFLKFFQSLGGFQYRSDGETAACLRKIMVNECLMQLRKFNSFLQLAGDDLPDLPADNLVLDHLSATEIFTLISQLPTGYRTVFNLFVVEDLSHKEIAAALGISEGTSRSQLNKARQLLQQKLIAQNADHAARKAK